MPTDTAPIYALDLYAAQGADFVYSFQPWLQPVPSVTPVDLTNYTALFTVNQYAWSTTPAASCTQVLSAQGQVILGGATGIVTVKVLNPITFAMIFAQGPYSLKLISPTGVKTLFALGRFYVDTVVGTL